MAPVSQILTDSLMSGILCIALYQTNWYEMSRVWTAPVLRETWSIPFFVLQLALLCRILARPHTPQR